VLRKTILSNVENGVEKSKSRARETRFGVNPGRSQQGS
jgi:hypothetical protein